MLFWCRHEWAGPYTSVENFFFRRQYGSWRGNKNCPGKPKTTYLAQAHTSLTISLAVNNKIMRAVVDTGSCYTIIKEATANEMGSEINKRRALPNFQGVTGSPLRILGMIWLETGVGKDHVHKQWFPVVPNSYLDADLLLGADVLSRTPFTWDGSKNIIVWGKSSYVISHIRRQRGKVERVRATPLTLNQSDQVKNIRLTKSIRMEPY